MDDGRVAELLFFESQARFSAECRANLHAYQSHSRVQRSILGKKVAQANTDIGLLWRSTEKLIPVRKNEVLFTKGEGVGVVPQAPCCFDFSFTRPPNSRPRWTAFTSARSVASMARAVSRSRPKAIPTVGGMVSTAVKNAASSG